MPSFHVNHNVLTVIVPAVSVPSPRFIRVTGLELMTSAAGVVTVEDTDGADYWSMDAADNGGATLPVTHPSSGGWFDLPIGKGLQINTAVGVRGVIVWEVM